MRGEEVEVIIALLYADERAPMTAVHEQLGMMRRAGVDEVWLLGTSVVSGQLETVGAWQLRILCPLGLLRFDDAEQDLLEFTSIMELTAAASKHGLQGLALRVP